MQNLLLATDAPLESLSWHFALPSLIVFTACAGLFVGLFYLRNEALGKIYRTSNTRLGFTIFFGLSSAITTLFADIIDFSKLIQERSVHPTILWTGPIFICSLACLIACLYLNWRHSEDIQLAEAQIDEFRRNRSADTARTLQLKQVVGKKTSRVKAAIRAKRKATPASIRDTLAPHEQLPINLGCLHACLFTNSKIPDTATLRLTLYLPSQDKKCMEHFLSTDGSLLNMELGHIRKHPNRFAFPFEATKPCLVLYAAGHAGLHLIGDSLSLTNEEKNKFHLFYPEQHQTLRSAFAFAIDTWSDGQPAVLMGHSNHPRAFSSPDYAEDVLLKDLEMFAARIAFELDMLEFLAMENSQ